MHSDAPDTLVHAGAARATPRAPPPLALGRYRLLERLGAGGFGVVWRARDEILDREVAVKRVPLPARDESDRAVREALAAARLAHPAIVALYEAGTEGDTFVLVSELVSGRTLATLIASRSIGDRTAAEIGVALADALEHAHARGVIHRDVKPQNVLVPDHPEEGSALAKLADFGGARLAGEETLTRTGDIVGTLAYMAPEQADGGEADEQSDLYSLALVLYEGFAGVNPVRGATPAATARSLGRRVPSLATRRPDLPRDLTRAIDVALDPRPHRRRGLDDLACALAEALDAGLPDRRGGRRRAPVHLRKEPEPVPLPPPRRPTPSDPVAHRRDPHRLDQHRLDLHPAPPAEHRSPIGLTLRAACALPAAALAAAAVSSPAIAGMPPRLGAPVAALAAGLVVGAAPRLGWVAVATATAAWAAAAGHGGAAVLLAAAALAVVALLRRPGPAWSAPALAPLLGFAGLAGAFPALAGQGPTWRRRAALAALGYWWLSLAAPLAAQRLWLGPPAALAAHPGWMTSASAAVAHVVWPLLTLGTLLGMLLWAAGAAALPWLVTGRSLSVDLVAATMWSAGLAAAAPALDRGLAHVPVPAGASPRGLVAGAILGGLLAITARAARGPSPRASPRPSSRAAPDSSHPANQRPARRGAVSRAL